MTTARGRFLRFFTFSMLVLSLASALFPRVPRGFAVETLNVGVYWNAECTDKVEFLDWGTLTPGSDRRVRLYLRNEELDTSCYMTFWTTEWNPSEAKQYLTLQWNYDARSVPRSRIVQVDLEISVPKDIAGITDFSFTLFIAGTTTIPADPNHDGTVNIFDFVLLASAYQTTPLSPNWNPAADLNNDGVVDIFDMVLLSGEYMQG